VKAGAIAMTTVDAVVTGMVMAIIINTKKARHCRAF